AWRFRSTDAPVWRTRGRAPVWRSHPKWWSPTVTDSRRWCRTDHGSKDAGIRMVSWPSALAFIREVTQWQLRGVPQGVLASYKDLERLENAAGLRGLLPGEADQDLGALPDELEALQEGGMQGERDQALAGLQAAEGAEAAVVHPAPRAFEFLAGSLPFVELPLSDLAPALEASHYSSPRCLKR